MFVRSKKSGSHRYLQIVESHWDDGHVRQRVIGTLGREDELRQGDKLDQLLCSLGKFADHALVLAAHEKGEATTIAAARIGPPLVFERLWRELGCGDP